MREDIYGGLKNALDRGEDLEKAVRSFIAAGYPEPEVREAAQAISSNAPIIPQSSGDFSRFPQEQYNQNIKNERANFNFQQVQQQNYSQINRKRIDWKLITLISILFILVVILIVSFFFKEQVVGFFSALF